MGRERLKALRKELIEESIICDKKSWDARDLHGDMVESDFWQSRSYYLDLQVEDITNLLNSKKRVLRRRRKERIRRKRANRRRRKARK